VIVKGFHAWGIKVVDHIIGMFAFALYDRSSRELFLVRDRLGVKPLYYQRSGDDFLFASELKAFHTSTSNFGTDMEGLAEFLVFGYTVENNTFYPGIKKVPPGHYLKISDGKDETHKYWDASEFVLDPLTEATENQLVDQLEELLVSSFQYRMVSDAPVGIFLSGGIDSSLLVAILAKHYGQVNTFTIGFDDPQYNEAPYAKQIATYFKTNHVERILSLGEAREELNNFYRIYDEPFYDSSGIPTALVTKVAKEHNMKVVLSSEGGDELFAGYPSYQAIRKSGSIILSNPSMIRKGMRGVLKSMNSLMPTSYWGNRLEKLESLLSSKNWMEYYINSLSSAPIQRVLNNTKVPPAFRFDIPEHLMKKLKPEELFMLWDIKYLLPNDFLTKIDRATMHYSLEAREPFLDHRLVEFALRIPLHYKIRNGQTKYLLRKVLERYIPAHYFNRPKMGFSIPLFSWFKQDLYSLIDQRLTKEEFNSTWPQIDYRWIEQEKALFEISRKKDKEFNLITLWKFLSLMLWSDIYKHPKENE
jgi:asparagine synthase (glutamine-hydrolysing)